MCAFGANNILLYLTSGYWSLAAEFKPLYHTWSLGVSDTGFNSDGSYSYQKLVSGGLIPEDLLFKDTLKRMTDGNRRFQYGELAR